MSDLAAAAYDAEREHVDTSLEVRDAMGVRDLMLRLAALEKTESDVRALFEQVHDRYAQRLAGIAEEKEAIRGSIEAFLLHVNGGEKVSIPDAGTAYLTTRNKGGAARVADAELFHTYLKAGGGAVAVKSTFDAKTSLDHLHDAVFYTTPDGKLVDRQTGEVIEIPGVEAVPETKTLGLRKAA